jgi:hypothetical protein
VRPSGRAEITGGWRALARESGFLLGMDLHVAVTAPNTLTFTVLRQPAAPPAAAAAGPSGATSTADSTALGGTSAGAKAAPCSKKRRSASSDPGKKPPAAKRQRGTAANSSKAAGAGQSAGAVPANAHPQTPGWAAVATTSVQGQQTTPVGSMQAPAQPAAAAGSPAGVHSPPGLLSRLGSYGKQVLESHGISFPGNAHPASPLPNSTQPEAAAAAGMPADASNAAAANSPQQGRCMSAPPAVAAAAHQSTAKPASATPAARKRAQRHSPDGAANRAAAPSQSRTMIARKAAQTAQAKWLASDLADSSSDEEGAEAAHRHVSAPAHPAAVQNGAAMRCMSSHAAAAAARDPAGAPADGSSIQLGGSACEAFIEAVRFSTPHVLRVRTQHATCHCFLTGWLSDAHVRLPSTPCCTLTLCSAGDQAQGKGIHSLSGEYSQHRCSIWSSHCAVGKRPQEGGGSTAYAAGPAAAAQRRSGRPHHCSGESGARRSDRKHRNTATLTNPCPAAAQQRNSAFASTLHAHPRRLPHCWR